VPSTLCRCIGLTAGRLHSTIRRDEPPLRQTEVTQLFTAFLMPVVCAKLILNFGGNDTDFAEIIPAKRQLGCTISHLLEGEELSRIRRATLRVRTGSEHNPAKELINAT